MGTTLTGTTPQDTYDSLIKVTDNGPLSGTAKYLSDGLGNDSALALSTAFVGSGTTAISNWQLFKGFQTIGGNAFVGYEDQAELWSNAFYDGAFKYYANGFATRLACINGEYDFNTAPENTSGAGAAATLTTRLKITNAGNVGIGTTAPVAKLQTTGTDAASIITGVALENFIATNPSSGNGVAVDFRLNNSGNTSVVAGKISTVNTFFRSNTDMVFSTFTSDALTEKARILSSGGITFNGDTAAANALDDYEEGTWTMGVSFGGASVGVTTSANTGTYTKIGRQVTVNGYISLTSKGSSTGGASITGLPFTIPNSFQNYAAASLWINNITFANQYNAVGSVNTTRISLEEVTELGVSSGLTNADFANNSEIIVSLTYFV